MNQDQKEQITQLVEEKMFAFQQDVQAMVNNFHIEIIRQFEIQKSSMENLVQDYLLDPEDNTQNMMMQGQGSMSEEELPDIADGDDLVFFNKYGDQGWQNGEEIDDEDFESGYYF